MIRIDSGTNKVASKGSKCDLLQRAEVCDKSDLILAGAGAQDGPPQWWGRKGFLAEAAVMMMQRQSGLVFCNAVRQRNRHCSIRVGPQKLDLGQGFHPAIVREPGKNFDPSH